MTDRQSEGVTQVLRRLDEGHAGAFSDLVDLVYDQLRGVAHNRRSRRFGDQAPQLTQQTTELVNEVLMEFQNQRNTPGNTEQFFAVATRLLMRRMTDYQRARLALKRDARKRGGSVEESDHQGAGSDGGSDSAGGDEIAEALERLHEIDPRRAEVVTLRIFRDLPLPKVAELIGVSLPTIERDWRAAKAWLVAELGESVLS